MNFAQEVKDFLEGYKTVTEIGEGKKKRKLDEKKADADIAYQNALIDLRRQELDDRRKAYAAAAAGKGSETSAKAFETLAKTPSAIPVDSGDVDFSTGYDNESSGTDWNMGTAAPGTAGLKDDYAMGYADGGKVQREDEDPPGRGPKSLMDQATESAAANTRAAPGTPPVMASRVSRAPAPPGTGAARASALSEDIAPSTPSADSVGRPQAPAGALPMASAATEGKPAVQPTPDRLGLRFSEPKSDRVPPKRADLQMPDESSMVADKDMPSRVVIGRAGEAVKLVLDGQEAAKRQPRAAIGGAPEQPADIVSGKGGLTPTEIAELEKRIDPNGELPRQLKTAAILSEAYTYFRNRGDNEKAYNIATKILAGEKQLSQTLGTLAMEAAKSGNPEDAIRLLGSAVDRFPTGYEIRMDLGKDGVMQYAVFDHGKEVERGKLTGAEFMQMAGQVANGQLYMQGLMQFANSMRPQTADPRAAIPAIETAASANKAFQDAQAALKAFNDSGEALDGGSAEKRARLEAAVQQAGAAFNKAKRAAIDGAISQLPQGASQKDVLDLYKAVDGMISSKAAAPAIPDDGTGTSTGNAGDGTTESVLAEARAAIAQGADPAKVVARLQKMGIDPSLLE